MDRRDINMAVMVLLLIGSVAIASEFIPQGDINLKGIYGIQNATSINASSINVTNIYSPTLSNYNETPQVNSLNSSKLDISDQRYNETAMVSSKLDITDQRYNDTSQISLKLDVLDQRYNDSLLISSINNTKLNQDDQRYNDTSINTSSNIKGLGFNLTSELISMFYSSTNPLGFITSTISGIFTAGEFNGNLNWTNIQNYPQACPSGSFLTAINDTNTCTVPANNIINITSANISDKNNLGNTHTHDTSNISSGTLSDARLSTNITLRSGYNISNANISCFNISGSTSNLCTLTDTNTITYSLPWINITSSPLMSTKSCTGTDKMSAYDNSTGVFTCSGDQTGVGGGGVNLSTTVCGGTDKVSGINNATGVVTCTPDQANSVTYDVSTEYSRSYYTKETGFESVTAGYTGVWVPTAIASGTPTLGAGTTMHPSIAYVSTSSTASSGYSFQITGASTYQLGSNYTTQLSLKPITKTGNLTRIKFGFMDTYVATETMVDAVWINLTQTNTTAFTARGHTRSNSAQSNTSTLYNLTNNTWYGLEIYIYNSSNATFRIYNESRSLLWQDSLNSNIPTVTGRETSHAVVAYTVGGTTAQILAYYDFMSVGINQSLVR